MSKKGLGWGGKEPPAFNPKHFTELRSPTNGEQFDWLVARQSNNDMKNLTLVHKPHPEYKKRNQKYDRVRGSFRILSSGNFERSFGKR